MDEFQYTRKIVALDQSVLIISDLHFPNAHPDWYGFLNAIKENYKPDIVVNVGDEVDGHRWSFHDSEEALPSADKELQDAIEEIQHLRTLWPKMFLCESNHGSLIYRRLKHMGVPIRSLRSLKDLYETPLWSWSHEIVLETHQGNVTVVHGKTGAYNKLSMEHGTSSIQGHFHAKFELTWQASTERTIFNMLVGCLVDRDSLAFNYGKNIVKKPIMGVGWINELGEPALIRMMTDKDNRWTGKL